MKNFVFSLLTLSLISFMISCSGDDPDVIIDDTQPKSGVFEFDQAGSFEFKVEGENVTATITLVGAGGGGAGGVGFNNGAKSTGGGGGGGAGEVKLVGDVSLQSNVTYIAEVGEGGFGGSKNNNGVNGKGSAIVLAQVQWHTAEAGSGGKSNTIGDNLGGSGGIGFPKGGRGGDGDFLDVNWDGPAGSGGPGGNNQSGYGFGGQGGDGTEIKNNAIASDAGSGLEGGDGYVKIEWKTN